MERDKLKQVFGQETVGVGFLGLPEAPVFYPSEEEFKDPLEFIDQIRSKAEPFGICRIVPPKSWNPPFALDSRSFSFPTKVQSIHQLQVRPAACDAETFKLEYSRFLLKTGRRVENWPIFCGKELDLSKFFSAVKRHGGYQKVVNDKKWGEVLQILEPACIPSALSNSLLSALSQAYENYLYEYELFQSSFSCGKRFRTSNMQDERCRSRGKRAARNVSAHMAESVALRVDADKLGLNKGASEMTVPCSGSQCISPADLLGKSKQVKIEEVTTSDGDFKADQVCEQCHSGAHEHLMLLCDRCDRGWHLYCLTPPLSSVPAGNWYCSDCITSERESFGFSPGLGFNLDSFRRIADRFKRKWFGTRQASCYKIEEEFWKVVDRVKGPVEVFYGSDLDTASYGSGFPRSSDPIPEWADEKGWKEHAANPWNLNNFAKTNGSLLRYVQENIPGVIVPWIYIGMLFSSFCWHYEDQCFYSINYLHWGEPKCWYSVPGNAADLFEQVMHKTFPDLFEAQPDLLFQLVTMLNPKVLCENDVPVCTTTQERGNFVITFPRSYHGGFNHGFNCAEAVNFATVDWLPFGWFGVERYRLYHKAAVLSHDELVCVVAKNSRSHELSPWVKKDLIRMIALERKQRERLWKIGVVRSSRMVPRMHPDVIGTEEDPECIICRYYLFLSAVTCNCSPGKAVCIQHAEHLCECSTDQQQLLYRFSLAELNDLLLSESENSAVCKSDISLTDSGKVKQRRRSRHSESPSIPMTAMKKVKGHLMSHAKLAEVWISKARNALCRTSHLSSIQGLLEEAEQFLWAGHEMDSVRMVEKDLIYVQSWAEDVASCIDVVKTWLEAGDCNPAKVCFVTAQQLVSVDPLPCIEDHFSKLKALVESAIRLQQQTKASFLSVPPLELTDLRTLQQEVLQSPFEFSEAMRLKNVIESAQAWGEEVQKILSHCGTCRNVDQRNHMDINKLHLLQLEGYKLPVSIPEKQVVDAVIKKVEVLTECLKEVLSTTVSLQEAEDLLHKIEELPVHIPQAELLEQWRYETQEWKKYARKVLADVQQQKDCFVCIELLSPLLETGECLKLGVEELDLVKAELRKFSWLDKASKALESPSSSKTLMDILEEGAKLSLENERLYLQICSVVEAAQIWESKAALFLEKGACLDDYRNLKSASDSIQIPLSGLGAINTVIMQAESWLLRAQPFVSRNQGNPHKFTSLDLRTLKSLVIESQSLKVSLDEIGLLQIALEEITAWMQSATVLLLSAKELLLSGQGKAQLCTGTPEEDIMLKKIILDNQEQLADLQSKVKDGLAFGFELQEIAELQILCAATEWNLKCLKLLLNSPTIQELELLIYEASSFSEYVGQLALLQNILHNARAWLEKVTVALHRRDPVLKFTVQQLEKFLTEAQALRVSLSPDVAYVENLLNAHKAWRKQILQYLDSQNFSISWADLHDLQEVGEASQVKSEEMDILVVEVVKVDNWILRCYEVLMGQSGSSSLLLKDILLKMQTSLDMGLQQVQGMMTTEMESLCCVCREYLDLASSSVLQCDNCKDRYHSSCPGCVQTQTRAQKQSLCPFCTAFITGVLCVHEKVYSKICTTKRPTLAALLELLNAAEGIRFRTQEFELLQRTVRKVEEWQACVRNISEPLLVQCNNQCNVDYRSLLASLKVVGTIEVKEDEGSKLKLAIAVNAWRMRARMLLESPSRPLYRSLYRILKEGLAVPVPAEDCFLDDLKKREQLASEWTSRAKEAIGDDGAMPVEEVCNLIVEGERLPVTLGKELTALRARTVLYCICRKPYDDERAMIACDRCSEWYHFDCVNLPEPDSSDDECEVLLQRVGSSGEFYCPNCKKFENKDTSRLVSELVENSDGMLKDGNGMHGTICTPPFRYARGKRSSRTSMKVKTDLQQRWGSSTILSMFSKERSKNAAEHCQTCLNASGRPCRRTAGQHRGFESFVLLTRSR